MGAQHTLSSGYRPLPDPVELFFGGRLTPHTYITNSEQPNEAAAAATVDNIFLLCLRNIQKILTIQIMDQMVSILYGTSVNCKCTVVEIGKCKDNSIDVISSCGLYFLTTAMKSKIREKTLKSTVNSSLS